MHRTNRLPALLLSAASLATAPRAAVAQEAPRAAPVVEITAEQEEAVRRGLANLAGQQNEDGSWTGRVGFKLNNGYKYTDQRGHVGVTAMAGMAFLAGGFVPGRGEYGPEVERALSFILSSVQEDGFATWGGTRMYSHAFAVLFLAEIYGMTHREDVRLKLQKAVDFIVTSQNEEGGWRYVPLARESDMSIVVCQVLALRAARNIGIRVPKTTIDRAIRYVVNSAVTDSHGASRHPMYRGDSIVGTFHYQPDDHSRTSFPLTAAGVTALNGLGIYSSELIDKGVEYLQKNLDTFNRYWGGRRGSSTGHYFYWYGHYYGVQAMYTHGGHEWEKYFSTVREHLLDLQRPDGSWPNGIGPGDAFGTATAVLILEIPYCFLPIFQR